jgi:hypothetical protein
VFSAVVPVDRTHLDSDGMMISTIGSMDAGVQVRSRAELAPWMGGRGWVQPVDAPMAERNDEFPSLRVREAGGDRRPSTGTPLPVGVFLHSDVVPLLYAYMHSVSIVMWSHDLLPHRLRLPRALLAWATNHVASRVRVRVRWGRALYAHP